MPDNSVGFSDLSDYPDYDEARCRRCGRCCKVKYVVGGVVFTGEGYCRYLDRDTLLCTIYDRRHEINPECLDVPAGLRLGVFPADCPYVEGVEGYVPPCPLPLDAETEAALLDGRIQTPEELMRLIESRASGPES